MIAFGEFFLILSTTCETIFALIFKRSALVISLFLGTPAVITTISQSFISSGFSAAVTIVPLGEYTAACPISIALPVATPGAISKSITS